MKFPKKAISLTMALTMAIGLTVPAMAAGNTTIQQEFPDGYKDAYTIQGGIGKETYIVGEDISYEATDGSINPLLYAGQNVEVFVVEPGKVANITGTNGTVVAALNLTDGKLFENDDFDWETNNTWVNLTWDTVVTPVYGELTELTEYNGYITLEQEGYYVLSAWKADALYQPDRMARVVHVTSTHEQPDAPAVPFTDVPATAYYSDAVKWAVEKGVTSGTSATTFSPDTTCTTAQILTFLWRANGSPEPAAASSFTDVPADAYYAKAAAWAAEKGLVSGTTFGGDAPCTRLSTVSYLWKLAGQPSAAGSTAFTDLPVNEAAKQAVSWAVEQGITSGTGATTFSPDNICTRGQIVTFLFRDMVE